MCVCVRPKPHGKQLSKSGARLGRRRCLGCCQRTWQSSSGCEGGYFPTAEGAGFYQQRWGAICHFGALEPTEREQNLIIFVLLAVGLHSWVNCRAPAQEFTLSGEFGQGSVKAVEATDTPTVVISR